MDTQISRIITIIVIPIAIGLGRFGARRLVSISKAGLFGIYFMLLPIGFNCFGFDISPLLVAGMAVSGLFLMLWGIGRVIEFQRAS